MDLQEFIEKFAEQLNETEVGELNAETEFKNLVDWSSLTALSIIVMINTEYGVTIKGEEIRKSETIEDLVKIVKKHKLQA